MKFLLLKTTDPYRNLAIEEYLLKNSQDDIFMLWQNSPTVVIGKNQNAYAEINFDYANKSDIRIARRITGGGAVYHDLGNINYTFITTKKTHGSLDFKAFAAPIIDAISDLGLSAELSGRNDIMIDGYKFSGNAQYTYNDRILHHGTILFSGNLDVLSSVLNVDKEKIESKAIKSVRSRVRNLSEYLPTEYNIEDFIKFLSDFIIKKFDAVAAVLPTDRIIDELEVRNRSNAWIFPEKDLASKYVIKKKRRFDFGTVEISLQMQNDIIIDARINGDYFEKQSVSELEDKLRGSALKRGIAHDAEKYIFGITNEEFSSLLFD